jgi:hypothetical protein
MKAVETLRGMRLSADFHTQPDTDQIRVAFDYDESEGQLRIFARGFTLNLRLTGRG